MEVLLSFRRERKIRPPDAVCSAQKEVIAVVVEAVVEVAVEVVVEAGAEVAAVKI